MAGNHEVPLDCLSIDKIKHLEDRVNGVSTHVHAIETELRAVAQKQMQMDGDVKVLTHKIEEHTLRSEERHKALIESINVFGKELRQHMIDEVTHLNATVAPIKESLSQLHSRWWSLAVWLLAALASGLLGTLLYIWHKMGVNP